MVLDVGRNENHDENISEKIYSPSLPTQPIIKDLPKKGQNYNKHLLLAIVASSVGSGFQHGYNTGVLNNPQKILETWMNSIFFHRYGSFPSTAVEKVVWSTVVSIFAIGGAIGGLLTAYVSEKIGRKRGLLLNNILVVLAVIFESTAKSANSIELLIIGRFIIGVNSGLNAGLAPLYLAEIAPSHQRGAIGTAYQLVITISILVAQILGLQTVLGSEERWPLLLACTLVPAAFQVLTLFLCPESPKYLLLSRGQEVAAQKSLEWLRGSPDVQDEMDSIKAEHEANKLLPRVTLHELFHNPTLKFPLIIALIIMVSQQFSGINVVMLFSSDIFILSGLSNLNASYATMAIGLVNVIMTVVSLVLVERAGRKTLLLIGFGGMAVDTLLLTITLHFSQSSNAAQVICIVLVLLFVIMFAAGLGSIPWFLVTEIFSQPARPVASSLAVCTNWLANFIVGIAFLPLKELIGAPVFIIFVILQCLFFLFIYKKVPETKNKSIEEITALFRQQSYK